MNQKSAYRIAAKAIREQRKTFAFEANYAARIGQESASTSPDLVRTKRIYDELSEALEFFEGRTIPDERPR